MTDDGENLAEHSRRKGSNSSRGIEISLGHALLAHLPLLLAAGAWTARGGTKTAKGIRPVVGSSRSDPVSESHRPDGPQENTRSPAAEARRIQPFIKILFYYTLC